MTSRQWWLIAAAVTVGTTLTLVLRYVFLKSLTVLGLFAAGLLLAYALDPVLDTLEHRGYSRLRAVWTVMLLFLAVLALGVMLVVPALVSQAQDVATNWGDYSGKANQTYQALRQSFEAYVAERYPEWDVVPFLDSQVTNANQWLSDHLPGALQWLSQRLLASVGAVGLGALWLLISFHFMLVIDPFRRGLREMLPRSADAEVDRVAQEINRMLAQYLRGIVLISVCVGIAATGVLTTIGLFYGTKYALIVGLITGVTYMVPYVGAIVSAATAGFVGYVTAEHSPWVAAVVSAVSMAMVNQVFDNLLTPRIVGRKVGLHPLVVLFATMTGFSLFGIWGMIVATPVAASVKILLARWLPVRGPDVTARAPDARLELDLAAGLRILGARLTRLREDIGKAFSPPNQTGTQHGSEHPERHDDAETPSRL